MKIWNTYFQGDFENTEQSYLQFCCILQSFEVDKLRFLVGVSISNSQKLIEWLYREVEGDSRPEKHHELIQQCYNFRTTGGTNSVQVPIDYTPGDTGTYPGT